ncbi:MAG: GNAT family N-acetyltransferase [Planctomycetales bacterium]|nr:GNAT family N-acetyltransferase [Planctomycetales bacterium]
MEIQIREANLNNEQHQQAVVDLLDAYAQIPMILGKPLSAQVRRDLIPGLQQHPTTIILLAFDQDLPIGIAVCFLGFSTFAARPLVNIHDIAVHPEHRGMGVGKLLLDSIEVKARQLNCCKVTLEVKENNARARQIYAAAGYLESCHGVDSGADLFLSKLLL